ncbi:MAG TPA: GAF and ANTAR domain-containing protein [Acidimicrobiales bacterium]|nr:GAF and ANTAR domain-containing protein [Acidimicrobiales bacterium]
MVDDRGHDVELAQMFADVARAFTEEHDVDHTLDRICVLAVKTIDACEAAGISIASGPQVTSLSTSDPLPRILDDIQSETQEGPCVDAIKEHEVFLTGSLSQETRWPEFSSRAHEQTGVQSILSLRLFVSADTMGALNLYSTQDAAFDEQDIAIGSVFAAHAAVALGHARREAQLEDKAATRDVIGMAKGIIMARQQVSDDEAFAILRRASQRMNVKIRELADRVVHPPPDEQPGRQSAGTGLDV